MTRLLLALSLAAVLGAAPSRAAAVDLPAPSLAPGAVVALRGTPHLWVADEQSVLHWVGDTRALQAHTVDWGARREVSLDELKSQRRGDPWLSSGLLKAGEPIYLVKWETTATAPTLLHIQSIADVDLYGINAGNYGSLVLDQAAWEAKYGMKTDTLQRGELAAAAAASTGPGAAIPSVAPHVGMLVPAGDIGPSFTEVASGTNEDPASAYLGAKTSTDLLQEVVSLYDLPERAVAQVNRASNTILAAPSERWEEVPSSGPAVSRLLQRRDRPAGTEAVLYAASGPYVIEVRALSLAGTDPALVQEPITRVANGIVARLSR